MRTAPKGIVAFQKTVLEYYDRHGRDLPWRRTKDPYKILLSEIMLQQTQVDRVKRYYERWTKRWPTVHDLAEAELRDVLKEWMGLGYNNRAKNLHESAKTISSRFKGDVLEAMEHYKELPGIGPYTSRAVRIFSANEDIVTVDTNIRRLLIHEFKLAEDSSDKDLWGLAERCLPKGRSRDWHNALMDYGAVVLTSRKTGIRPKTRQPKFEGSDRQIRAGVLKILLGSDKESASSLQEKAGRGADEGRMGKVLDSLIKDDLIMEEKGKYRLK